MSDTIEFNLPYACTDGQIALNNLESARRSAWSRFWRDPLRPGIAEYIVEQEQLTLQFVGDAGVLDRLGWLISQLDRVDARSSRSALIHAQVASMAHRFAEARRHLELISDCEEFSAAADRLSLSIDQACGIRLEAVLETRRRIASESGRLEDLVPLGALYADLGEFDQADRIYQQGLRGYQDASPFAAAWVCFQLGVLWGELIPEVELSRAAGWYDQAIRYVPGYVKARVHLAEIYLRREYAAEAEKLLDPAKLSGDPEVSWRLADALIAMERFAEAEEQMQTARLGYEALLRDHMLAFADHGAEFYMGSGNDPQRAFELAVANLENRPTMRAFEQAYEAAVGAGELEEAKEILADARDCWGGTRRFQLSPLAQGYSG